MKNHSITVSAPGKIHLLGEHAVVYGKPALLTTVDLRVTVSVIARSEATRQSTAGDRHANARDDEIHKLNQIIEPIVKKHLKIKTIPPYQLNISSQIPIGTGLGSSAAISASYIAALLSFLKVKWDLNLINSLTFEAEKVFHGNPSGADNTAVIYGGLILYTKGKPIQPLPFSIPTKLAKNFILINTGKPKEFTKEMVKMVNTRYKKQETRFKKIFDHQEQLVKELLLAIQAGNETQLIQIIRAGEENLESIGVVSSFAKSIIRKIEKAGGTAKICGAGGKTGPTGILLCYHSNPLVIQNLAKSQHLDHFRTALGVMGLKQES